MDSLLLALSLLLAGVFATAGVAKLLDLAGSRRALEDFGVPARFARPGGLLLPLAEIAIAVALVFPASARWGALAAAVLLAVFVLAIGNAMAHGRAPDCHCFGQVHSEPAGWSTLARNGLLMAMAALVAAAGPAPAVDDWVAARSVVELVLVGAALVAAGVAAYKLRAWSKRRAERRRVQGIIARWEAPERPAGLPVGSVAPAFSVRDTHGETLTLETLRARGRPVALVFVNPSCPPCKELLAQIGEWQEALAPRLTIAILSDGTAEANRHLWETHHINDFLLQEKYAQVLNLYKAEATPAAVVVDPDGTIGSPTAGGPLAIEELIRLTLRRSERWGRPSLVA
jgi:peroxiredoxin/uncharacterized membrane protein YphA (DoxX/SURF4 family)